MLTTTAPTGLVGVSLPLSLSSSSFLSPPLWPLGCPCDSPPRTAILQLCPPPCGRISKLPTASKARWIPGCSINCKAQYNKPRDPLHGNRKAGGTKLPLPPVRRACFRQAGLCFKTDIKGLSGMHVVLASWERCAA